MVHQKKNKKAVKKPVLKLEKAVKKPVSKLDTEKPVKKSMLKLNTGYVMIPLEKRVQVLYTFIKKNLTKKVIIFVSTCEGAQFFEEFMRFENVPIMTIHGKYTVNERKNILTRFRNSKSAILVCNEKYAKINSSLNLDWVVQFDPPKDFSSYFDRLATISSIESCQSLLFISEEEMEVIRHLKTHRVDTELIDIQWAKVNNVQAKLERLVKEKHAIYVGARLAFAGYIKAYNEHESKNIYSISNISLTKAAMNFGFRVPPFVDLSTPKVKEEKRKREVDDAEKLVIKRVYRPVKKLKIGAV